MMLVIVIVSSHSRVNHFFKIQNSCNQLGSKPAQTTERANVDDRSRSVAKVRKHKLIHINALSNQNEPGGPRCATGTDLTRAPLRGATAAAAPPPLSKMAEQCCKRPNAFK